MKLVSSSRLAAITSSAGAIILGLMVLMPEWAGLYQVAVRSLGLGSSCGSPREAPHVYELNPRYGTEYEGKDMESRNESEACELQLRKLLERDEIRHRLDPGADLTSGNVFPVHGRVYPDGLYFIAVGVGNPARTYYLDIDTGSDLMWLTCDAPCVSCAEGPHAWYKPMNPRLVDCGDDLCSTVQIGHIQGCSRDDHSRQCDYDVHYGDGSSSQGVLLKDEMLFLHPSGKLMPVTLAFGCAYDQEGALSHSPSKTDGIVGLGSGPVSLPSQLAAAGIISNMVGHCLAPAGSVGGYLFLGSELVPASMTWTPMLGKPKADYYYVNLQKVRYGSKTLSIQPDVFARDNGGTIFDSGSSFTYLVQPAFNAFFQAVAAGLATKHLVHNSSDPALPHCWRGTQAFKSVSEASHLFERVELDFGGGSWFWKDAILPLEPDNYLLVNAQGNICLGILDSGDLSPGGATTIIGDVALQGYLVVYDNVHLKVGWVQDDCIRKP